MKSSINSFSELESEIKKKVVAKNLLYDSFLIQYKDADDDMLVIGDEDEFLQCV